MEATPSAAAAASEAVASADDAGLLSSLYVFFFGSPVNAILTTVCAWLVYRLFRSDSPRCAYPVVLETRRRH